MENCDRTNCPGSSILCLYVPAHKAGLFEKFRFFAHIYISFKITWILLSNGSLEEGSVVGEIYYFNLMVSCLYSCNLFIGINQIDQYVSCNNK